MKDRGSLTSRILFHSVSLIAAEFRVPPNFNAQSTGINKVLSMHAAEIRLDLRNRRPMGRYSSLLTLDGGNLPCISYFGLHKYTLKYNYILSMHYESSIGERVSFSYVHF